MMTNRQSGIEIREAKRDKQEQKRFLLAQKLIDQHISLIEIEESQDQQQLFNLMWQEFDNKLSTNKHFQDIKKYSEGYNHAIKYCQESIEDKNIDVGFPKLIINSFRPKSFRTREWFENSKLVLDFYLKWMKTLENKASTDITESDVFLSLVFHSAVLKVAVLQAILDQISKKRLVIEKISGLPVITIIIDDNSYHTNMYIDAKAVHQAQVFLSPLSTYMVQSYLKNRKRAVVNKSENLNIYGFYKRIQTIEKNQNGDINFGLKKFLSGAIYVLESYLSLDMPEHAWYIIADTTETTYSLSTSNWQSLIYNIKHNVDSQQGDLIDQQISTSNAIVRSNPKLTVEIAKLFRRNSTTKISKKVFTKELTELHKRLISNDAPLSEIAIVGFLLSKTASCKVSSIQTYSNRVTNRWLALTQNVTLEDYRKEDFVALYNEMTELSKGDNAKNKAAAVISEVHQYMVQYYNVEPIASLSTDERAHHKAGYISENMFQAIMVKIDELKVTVDQKHALSLALILGHRCGLRIGEIVKIRLSDVSKTQNYLEIRNNKLGNNKSLSATRRVLLAQLLTESDTKLLKRVYGRRSNVNGQTLISSQDGIPYNAQALSKMLSSIIKEVTGLDYLTTHHLRHSCLSNLQLISFLYDKDYQFASHPSTAFLKSLLPYEDDQALGIINCFETNLAYKKIYSLAGIAGHASPNTTFSSYVHFTDIETGLLLWNVDFKLSVEHSELLKIPRRKKSIIKYASQDINEYLMDKLELSELPKPKRSKILNVERNEQFKRYVFDEIYQILGTYDPNGNFEDLINPCDASEKTVRQWYYNAQQLIQAPKFQTKKGNPRLFSLKNNTTLLPVKDKYSVDRKVMLQMTDKFRSLYQQSKDEDKKSILQFVHYILTHAQYQRNYIMFDQAEDLSSYLKIICQLVYKKNIRLKLFHYKQASEEDKNSWEFVLQAISRSQINSIENKPTKKISYQKKIRVELSLASQTESERIKNRVDSNTPINQWNVRTIQIFCHYVYILIGEKIEKFEKIKIR